MCVDACCERFFLDTPGLLCYAIHMISSTQMLSTITQMLSTLDATDTVLEALP